MTKKVSIKTPLGELEWEPNEDEIQVAWLIFVELSTRLIGYPIADQQGFARDGLRSLYELFQESRQILRRYRPTIANQRSSAGSVIFYMLNGLLRPFLTRWHEKLRSWEDGDTTKREQEWPERREFFEELVTLQEDLEPYRTWFGHIADVHIL